MDYMLTKAELVGCAIEHEHNIITIYHGTLDKPLTVAVTRYDESVQLNVIGQNPMGLNRDLKYIVIHKVYNGAQTVEFYFENNIWLKD